LLRADTLFKTVASDRSTTSSRKEICVTTTEDGPQIAKITLEGIYDRKGRDPSLKEM
jgi:hypothetical protein